MIFEPERVDLSEGDYNYLALVALAINVPTWRLWYAMAFRDRSALDRHEWERLERALHAINHG